MTKKWTSTVSGIQPKRLASKRRRAADRAETRLKHDNRCRCEHCFVPSCHDRERKDWCDPNGPGDFMGHTCRNKLAGVANVPVIPRAAQ